MKKSYIMVNAPSCEIPVNDEKEEPPDNNEKNGKKKLKVDFSGKDVVYKSPSVTKNNKK